MFRISSPLKYSSLISSSLFSVSWLEEHFSTWPLQYPSRLHITLMDGLAGDQTLLSPCSKFIVLVWSSPNQVELFARDKWLPVVRGCYCCCFWFTPHLSKSSILQTNWLNYFFIVFLGVYKLFKNFLLSLRYSSTQSKTIFAALPAFVFFFMCHFSLYIPLLFIFICTYSARYSFPVFFKFSNIHLFLNMFMSFHGIWKVELEADLPCEPQGAAAIPASYSDLPISIR